MKILFELDNGAYVLEILPKRLYAKIEKHTDIPTYSATVSPLLHQGHFKEYRDSQPDFEEMMYSLIRSDLKDVSIYGNMKYKSNEHDGYGILDVVKNQKKSE